MDAESLGWPEPAAAARGVEPGVPAQFVPHGDPASVRQPEHGSRTCEIPRQRLHFIHGNPVREDLSRSIPSSSGMDSQFPVERPETAVGGKQDKLVRLHVAIPVEVAPDKTEFRQRTAADNGENLGGSHLGERMGLPHRGHKSSDAIGDVEDPSDRLVHEDRPGDEILVAVATHGYLAATRSSHRRKTGHARRAGFPVQIENQRGSAVLVIELGLVPGIEHAAAAIAGGADPLLFEGSAQRPPADALADVIVFDNPQPFIGVDRERHRHPRTGCHAGRIPGTGPVPSRRPDRADQGPGFRIEDANVQTIRAAVEHMEIPRLVASQTIRADQIEAQGRGLSRPRVDGRHPGA